MGESAAAMVNMSCQENGRANLYVGDSSSGDIRELSELLLEMLEAGLWGGVPT